MNDHRQRRERQRAEQEWLEESHRAAAFGNAPEKEAHQHILIALVQLHPVVVHAGGAHHLIQLRQVNAHRLAIIPRDQRRIGQHRLAAFHIDKARGPVEIESRAPSGPADETPPRRACGNADAAGGFQFRRRHKEIGENDHQRALADFFRGVVQRREQRRAAHRLRCRPSDRAPRPRCDAPRLAGISIVRLAPGSKARPRRPAAPRDSRACPPAAAHNRAASRPPGRSPSSRWHRSTGRGGGWCPPRIP